MSQTCSYCYKIVDRACQSPTEAADCPNLKTKDFNLEWTADDFSRPIFLHVCKDGTISYRTHDQPIFNGVAIPIFTVNTVEQAENIQVRFCRRQYTEHPLIPNKPWFRWTDFGGELENLEEVRRKMKIWYFSEFCPGPK